MSDRDDHKEQLYLRAYARHQERLEASERFESVVMFLVVLIFIGMAWWVS